MQAYLRTAGQTQKEVREQQPARKMSEIDSYFLLRIHQNRRSSFAKLAVLQFMETFSTHDFYLHNRKEFSSKHTSQTTAQLYFPLDVNNIVI
jgi:hypothetical protein